jgi:hypothetical protein
MRERRCIADWLRRVKLQDGLAEMILRGDHDEVER